MAKKLVKPGAFIATGRRKKSVARVRLYPGSGVVTVNGKTVEEYFSTDALVAIAKQPLTLLSKQNDYDVVVNVFGGGIAGQAGAVCHGLARALVLASETYKPELKAAGLLTRDSRMKERKKYGLKKARKAPQFSKR